MKKIVLVFLLCICTACGNKTTNEVKKDNVVDNFEQNIVETVKKDDTKVNDNLQADEVKKDNVVGNFEQNIVETVKRDDTKVNANLQVNEVKKDIYEISEIPVSEVIENNKRAVEGKGVYKSIPPSKKVIEYNKKIYLADEGKLYEISEDLTNSKLLSENVDSFEINDSKLYSENLCLDLNSGKIKSINNLIYVDGDVLLLQLSDSVFNIVSDKANSNVTVNLENGEFLRKIDNKLFFQQNMLESSSLYYMEIGDLSLKLINKEEIEKLWKNIDMENYVDENVSIEKIKRNFMEIDEITLVDNKIYYSYIVNDFDLTPRGIGAGGYDKKIICLDIMGENKRIETIFAADGPAYHVDGAYLSERMYSEDGMEEKERYKIEFKEDYFMLGYSGNSEIARIMKSYSTNRGEKWSIGKVTDLDHVIYISIENWGISGWRDYIEDKDHYFIRKDGFKVVECEEGKLKEMEYETGSYFDYNSYFINSIEPYGEDYLIKGTICELHRLTKEEINKKFNNDETIYIEEKEYKIVKSDKEYYDYMLKGEDIDYELFPAYDNVYGISGEGREWGGIWQLTDKVEFIVDKDASFNDGCERETINEFYLRREGEIYTAVNNSVRLCVYNIHEIKNGKCVWLNPNYNHVPY